MLKHIESLIYPINWNRMKQSLANANYNRNKIALWHEMITFAELTSSIKLIIINLFSNSQDTHM